MFLLGFLESGYNFACKFGKINKPLSMSAPEIQMELQLSLTAAEFIDVLQRPGLAARRPVDCPVTIQGMLENADLIATARTESGLLVGVARSITDFHYCTYLSDLAVDQDYQRQGIGRRLLEFSHQQAGRHTTLILLAAPQATSYYPHVGLEKHPSCWLIPRSNT